MTTRNDVQTLVERLRQHGQSWLQIADELRRRYRVTALIAIRMAHGWTRQQVADAWQARWPQENPPPQAQTIAYWEAWQGPGGFPMNLPRLIQLAELYQVAASDLLDGVGDYRHLDQHHPGTDLVQDAPPDGMGSTPPAALPSAA